MGEDQKQVPPFKLTVLGCGSAIPTNDRNAAAQVLSLKEKLYLIDCAEGTQLQLRKNHFKINNINHIFISHLHGDHYLGIIGLISTLNLMGRTNDLNIYCPAPLEEIITRHLEISGSKLEYCINFRYLRGDKVESILLNKDLEVFSIPLYHRILTCGFLFKEVPKERNIKKEFIEQENPDIDSIMLIKKGSDFVNSSGKRFLNEDITYQSYLQRSFAYISDTLYNEEISKAAFKVDLLYHEATFSDDLAHLAKEKFHSTAREAALIAKLANAKKLLIGHFSSRFGDLSPLLIEAQNEFPNTIIAQDGLVIEIPG